MEKKIKTCKDWKGDLSDYLQVGDLVDNDIVDHFIWIVPPITHTEKMIQMGEPFSGATYLTLVKTEEGWMYAGMCYKGKNKNVIDVKL